MARSVFCPFGVPIQTVPLSFGFVALIFSFCGSWHCSYFQGASISFTGSHFGLWTLEDIEGNCQRWDVLFFSYNLGAPLSAARIFSMTCMLVGLSLVTTMAQALQFHIVRYVFSNLWWRARVEPTTHCQSRSSARPFVKVMASAYSFLESSFTACSHLGR